MKAFLCLLLLCCMRVGEAKYSGNYDGDTSWPTWLIVFTVLCVIFLICFCGCCFWLDRDTKDTTSPSEAPQISYEGTTPCYMCQSRIKQSWWNSGEHRKLCFNANKEEILRYPTPQSVYCPKCGAMLRLWPKQGSSFICDNMDRDECVLQTSSPPFKGMVLVDGGREIVNTGINRFNCFICDYDLCQDCVLQEASAPPKRTFARGNSIKYNKYNYDPNNATFPMNVLPAHSSAQLDDLPLLCPSQSFADPSNQEYNPPYQEPQPHSPPGVLHYGIHPTPTAQVGLPNSINPTSSSPPSAPSQDQEQSLPPSYSDAIKSD